MKGVLPQLKSPGQPVFCLPLARMATPRELDSDPACPTANAGHPSHLYGPHFLHFPNEKAGTLVPFN